MDNTPNKHQNLNRRDFLRFSGLSLATLIALDAFAGCKNAVTTQVPATTSTLTLTQTQTVTSTLPQPTTTVAPTSNTNTVATTTMASSTTAPSIIRPVPGNAPKGTGKTVVQQIGLIQNDAKAFNGYTLLAPKHYTTTYLIDNAGSVINAWRSNYLPGQSAYLLPNGHLLRSCFTKNQAFIGGGEGGGIEEYDWEGNLVWEFWYTNEQHLMHHDIKPLPNGNVVALAVEKKTIDECIAAGFQSSTLKDKYLYPDTVVEIKPTGPNSGEVIWEWHVWDHLIQDENQSMSNFGNVALHPELVDVQCNGGRETVAFWNHMNSIDYNPVLDQILLSVRGSSEIWVVDHSTTKAESSSHSGGRGGKGGDLLYRWGNPQAYGIGNAGAQQLFQQHDAQWIEVGSLGAGDMLIYNNGLARPAGIYSTIDEIVPPVDKLGSYSRTAGSAYGPSGLLWTYKANPPSSLYSEAISGCQRMSNGNTLICDGVHGVLFEVTSSGETVWKYVNPVLSTGPATQGTPIPLDDRGHQLNAVFKIRKYAPDYPGLSGKKLVPGDPIVK